MRCAICGKKTDRGICELCSTLLSLEAAYLQLYKRSGDRAYLKAAKLVKKKIKARKRRGGDKNV